MHRIEKEVFRGKAVRGWSRNKRASVAKVSKLEELTEISLIVSEVSQRENTVLGMRVLSFPWVNRVRPIRSQPGTDSHQCSSGPFICS